MILVESGDHHKFAIVLEISHPLVLAFIPYLVVDSCYAALNCERSNNLIIITFRGVNFAAIDCVYSWIFELRLDPLFAYWVFSLSKETF